MNTGMDYINHYLFLEFFPTRPNFACVIFTWNNSIDDKIVLPSKYFCKCKSWIFLSIFTKTKCFLNWYRVSTTLKLLKSPNFCFSSWNLVNSLNYLWQFKGSPKMLLKHFRVSICFPKTKSILSSFRDYFFPMIFVQCLP